MILTDHETKVDLLNNEAIAATIIRLLRERPEHPITVGVHGDWGAGKSSILEMIESGLDEDDKALCIKFNGWRFQGFEDAKIALIEGIVTGLVDRRPALRRAGDTVQKLFKRIDWLKVAKRAGGLALTAFTGIPTAEQVSGIVDTLQGFVTDPKALATKENLTTAIEEVKAVIKPTETKHIPEEVEEFRKEFDALLKAADIDQLVVLVDDLDRCLPEAAIETLEAIRLFVFTQRTAFVIAADEAMIEYAVRKHFPDLPETTGPRDYARNYLEKLIQVPFRIPALGETETRIYVTLLLIGAAIGETDGGYGKLIEAAREKLKRPWTSTPLDSTTVQSALGGNASKASEALFLSDQIGPILATGSMGNPRQIKRFLNTLLLRHQSAEARGFGAEIKMPVLAKLMLAERYIPSLFDQIATVAVTHSEGRCTGLAELESSDSAELEEEAKSEKPAGKEKQAKAASSSSTLNEPSLLAEWRSSQEILAWARVQPPIGTLDLRPYLFATKDRKNYFGPATVLGHLALVAEKLLGPKLTVQGLEPELKRLAKPEAEKLFHALRNKILAPDALNTKPAGVEGMVVLVKAQPHLHSLLLDFLKGLPTAKCGTWVVGGWDYALRGTDSEAGLRQLIEHWASVEGNAALKMAANATLRSTQRRGR